MSSLSDVRKATGLGWLGIDGDLAEKAGRAVWLPHRPLHGPTGQRVGAGRYPTATGGAQSQVLPGFTLTTAVHGKETLPSVLELIST